MEKPKERKISEGAEAIIYLMEFPFLKIIKKVRIEKKYREKTLDYKLRFSRTKIEAKILHKAKEVSVPCPYVLGVEGDFLLLQYLEGATLNNFSKVPNIYLEQSARYLANLHKADIIHGDYTFANLFLTKNKKLYVIDFGLSFISHDSEDKAVDLLTMLKSLPKNKANLFAIYYEKFGDGKIVQLAKKIQKRARYEERN
ncbi:MAG: KEOPS complex kinase/ATPase Bud32 [Candidatus Anstonellaceae archaeon]